VADNETRHVTEKSAPARRLDFGGGVRDGTRPRVTPGAQHNEGHDMDYLPADSRYKSMLYNRVGASGVRLPAISLGLWHNFGDVDVFQNGRTIARRAFDLGITHFDLANNYGPSPGSAEENFGALMRKDFHPFRDEMIISSKAGYLMWPGPYGEWGSRKYLVASCDQSLKRMGLPYVDIFYSTRTRRSKRPWGPWTSSCVRAARCTPASPATAPSRPRARRRSCASSARPA
jgi:aldo/keto reductase family protein